MGTVALTKDTFEETVTKPGITLVDWWASWCGPCRMFALDMPFAGTFGRVRTAQALDPQVMVTLTGRPELKPVAGEAGRRLARALAALTS